MDLSRQEKARPRHSRPRDRRLPLSLLMASIALPTSLALAETALRTVGGRGPYRSFGLQEWARPHPILGWVNRPGVSPSEESGHAPMTFLDDGRRASAQNESARAMGHPRVVVVGGSWTQGHGVRDEETFAWLLNERHPDLFFENHGTGAYGTHQSLLLLESRFAETDTRPQLVIYGFVPGFHPRRNVLNYPRIEAMRTRLVDHLAPPAVVVDGAGRLVRQPPFSIRAWPSESRSALVHVLHDAYIRLGTRRTARMAEGATKALLLAMNELTEKKGAELLVVMLHYTGRYASYVDFFDRQGLEYADCSHPRYGSPEGDSELRIGGSGHPNKVMHAHWARCISDWLVEGSWDAPRE